MDRYYKAERPIAKAPFTNQLFEDFNHPDAVHEIDPSIITIGEGWVMNTELEEKKRANQQQAALMPRIALFNDGFRDAVKGDIFQFDYKGFVSGGVGYQDKVKRGIVGGISISNCYGLQVIWVSIPNCPLWRWGTDRWQPSGFIKLLRR